jgi:starch synthase
MCCKLKILVINCINFCNFACFLLTISKVNYNMEEKRILYVSSEVVPYLAENEVSLMSYDVPKMVNDQGGQIRIFMPRYGNINERRHQLHEVIRLSGMNLVVNDLDMPLIIKVASIPKERIQVYFIDNDEYFKRKATFADEEGVLYADNDERAIFFAKGVVETVKKLNWVPDIIHVHGWMAAMLPIYMKHFYKDEALFAETKIVTSVYGQSFEGNLDLEMINKIKFDGIPASAILDLETPNYENIIKATIQHSDGVIIASENVSSSLTKFIESSGKPFLPFTPKDKFAEAYTLFYKNEML